MRFSDPLWLATFTEEHLFRLRCFFLCGIAVKLVAMANDKSYVAISVSSESGRALRSPGSPREVSADDQRRQAHRPGSIRLRSAQQDRRPSEEHVPGH